MKVLFIVKDLEYECMGIMSLSSVLKLANHDVDALCVEYEDNLISKIKEINPDIIGYSCTTGVHKYYLELNQKLKKEFEFISILGGPHPTFFTEILEEDGVDAICVGEGDEAFIDFANALDEGKGFDGIGNIFYKKDGNIVKNELRPFIEDLDSLPFPDRKIFSKYNDMMPSPYRVFLTGRGCPFSCSYCFNHAFKKMFDGKYIRHRSVDLIIKEIEEVNSSGNLRLCGFLDDTFTINRKWLLDFCKSYRDKLKIPFFCHLRADLVDEEISKLLSEAGCIAGVIGVETGSYEMRKRILHKNIKDEDILESSRLMKEHGIRVITQNMVGIPEDTVENVMKMIKINSQIGSNHMNLYFYQPYPRTDLCNLSIEKGLYSGDVDEIRFSYSAYESDISLDLDEKDDLRLIASIFHLLVRVPIMQGIISLLIKIPVLKKFIILMKPLDSYFRRRDYLKIDGHLN